jgi:hypothetical protein
MTTPGHHAFDCPSCLGAVKARRCAPTLRAVGLDSASGQTGEGIHVMAQETDGLASFRELLSTRGANRLFERLSQERKAHDA